MEKLLEMCMPCPQEDSIQLGAREGLVSLGNRHDRETGENHHKRSIEDADIKPPRALLSILGGFLF
jgi:hypothetical protein